MACARPIQRVSERVGYQDAQSSVILSLAIRSFFEMREIAKLLDKQVPDFAVISTLENSPFWCDLNEQKTPPVNRAIITLARQCCPIVMITHSTWDKKNKCGPFNHPGNHNYADYNALRDPFGDQVKVTLKSKIGL